MSFYVYRLPTGNHVTHKWWLMNHVVRTRRGRCYVVYLMVKWSYMYAQESHVHFQEFFGNFHEFAWTEWRQARVEWAKRLKSSELKSVKIKLSILRWKKMNIFMKTLEYILYISITWLIIESRDQVSKTIFRRRFIRGRNYF